MLTFPKLEVESSTVLQSQNTTLYNALDRVPYYENNGKIICLEVNKSRLSYVVAELVATEESYVTCLNKIIYKYKPYLEKQCPKGLLKELPYLFGNIEKIYRDTKKFLKLLQTKNDVVNIATAFIISESLFQLYPAYVRNKPIADKFYQHFEKIAAVRQQKLNDRADLRTYLMAPILRMGRYILLLRAIQEELGKNGEPACHISTAINIMTRLMRRSNDLIAIDLIRQSFINLEKQGSFILAEKFKMIKPAQRRNNKVMVFLFEKILIFTLIEPENSSSFRYLRSISITDMSVIILPQDPLLFEIDDHPKVKQDVKSDQNKYILRADNPQIKKLWTEILQQILWQQFKQARVRDSQVEPDDFSTEVILYLNKLRPLNLLVESEQQQIVKNLFCL